MKKKSVKMVPERKFKVGDQIRVKPIYRKHKFSDYKLQMDFRFLIRNEPIRILKFGMNSYIFDIDDSEAFVDVTFAEIYCEVI